MIITADAVFVTSYQIEVMKVIGIIMILIGIEVFIFHGIRPGKKEKVLDLGPVEITKQGERSDSWQLYAAGGIAVVAALILAIAGRRKIPDTQNNLFDATS